MDLPHYHLHALIGRTATLQAAMAAAPEAARLIPLRFGLTAILITDELIAALGDDGAEPPFIEFIKLSARVMTWARAASVKGPVAYVEAEQSDGAGWHAAVLWQGEDRTFGPVHLEDRSPVNHVLRQLGVVATRGDEFDALGLAALC